MTNSEDGGSKAVELHHRQGGPEALTESEPAYGRLTAPQSRPGIDLDEWEDPTARPRVLVVDDDPDTVGLLKLALRRAGMDVMGALGGYEALRKCASQRPDIILLDLMMPEVDGWETYRSLRQITRIPVLILSAKAAKEDIVTGLENGVDDYLTKPFYTPEVVARIRAVLRRAPPLEERPLAVFPSEGLVVDFGVRQVTRHNEQVHLTPREFALLEVLAENAPRPVAYGQIATEVWGDSASNVVQRIKYLVFSLRRKLGTKDPETSLIVNHPRFGYAIAQDPGRRAPHRRTLERDHRGLP